MADDVSIKDSSDAARVIATDEVAGRNYQIVKNAFGALDAVTLVDASNGLPVEVVGTVPVSGTVTASGPLTDAQLRAAAVPVSGTVTASGPLTDAQLRASAVTMAANLRDGAGTALTSTLINSKQRLDVNLSSAGTTGVAVPSTANLYGGSDGTNLQALSVDTTGRLRILAQADGTASGSLTSTTSVTFTPPAASDTVAIDLRGTFVATLQFEGSIDGTNFFLLNAAPIPTGALVTSATAAGAWVVDVAGMIQTRVRCSAYTSGTVTVTLRSSAGTSLIALDAPLPTGANIIGALSANQSSNVAQINAVAPLMGNGVTGTGSLRVTIASDTTANTNPYVTKRPTPTQSFVNSAATTNATSVKASAGGVFGVICSNAGGAAAFVKFYNKASAPTVGTDVPVITIAVPASGHAELNFGAYGHQFATGIALAITNLVADTDTTAVAAAQVKVATSYV